MKAAVSIPDEVFEKADRLARKMKTSRSRLYSRAIREFVDRHSPERVTEAMNQVCDGMDAGAEPIVKRSARRVLERSEW